MDAIETIERCGFTGKLFQDPDPSNPREDDNAGTIATWHRRYALGDVQPKESSADYIAALPANSLILPVYMYDHGGITINTTGFICPWDSGQLGIIHISPDRIRETWGAGASTRENARKFLVGEIETYDHFLTGDVYGYVVTNAAGDEVDSCWGFYGDEYAKSDMEAAFNAAIRRAQADREVSTHYMD